MASLGVPGGGGEGFSGDVSVMTANRKREEEITDRLHAKTYGAWANHVLRGANVQLSDLFTDFQDGLKLIALLETIFKEPIKKYNAKPDNLSQKLENISIALNFLQSKIGNLNMNPKDIMDGNRKVILGMMWRLVMKHQILVSAGDDQETNQRTRMKKAKDSLLDWVRQQVQGYRNVSINDFTNSFQDGMAFCALVHKLNPSLINYDALNPSNTEQNLEAAFAAAEKLGIPRLLDAKDMCAPPPAPRPDEQCIMTYVSEFPVAFLSKFQEQQAAAPAPAQAPAVVVQAEPEINVDAFALERKSKLDELRAKNKSLKDEYEKMKQAVEDLRLQHERLQAELLATKNKLIGRVKVVVKQGRNLAAKDVGGTSDPYVTLKLDEQKHKTEIKKETLNPVWNQEFTLFITSFQSVLEVQVYDWDRFTADDFMGRVNIRLMDLVDGKTHESWFTLETGGHNTEVSGDLLLALTYLREL